jgi:hypothetical protein
MRRAVQISGQPDVVVARRQLPRRQLPRRQLPRRQLPRRQLPRRHQAQLASHPVRRRAKVAYGLSRLAR